MPLDKRGLPSLREYASGKERLTFLREYEKGLPSLREYASGKERLTFLREYASQKRSTFLERICHRTREVDLP